MKLIVLEQFYKDTRKINDKATLRSLKSIIAEIDSISNPTQLKNIKKIKGQTDFWRIRIGNYRIGLLVNGESIEFQRILHRKDIYKYFPKK